MALLRFSKLPKHRQYEYKPRYWDPEKEDLDQRLRRAEARKQDDEGARRERIKSGLRRGGYTRDNSAMRQQVVRTNLRLVAIMAVLFFAAYMVLTQYLPRWLSLLDQRIQ